MENKTAFIGEMRERVGFVLAEIGKIPISQVTKSEILSICQEITNILDKADKLEDGEILEQLRRQLSRFDVLINSIMGEKQEMAAYNLLNTQQTELIGLVDEAEGP